MRSYGRIRVAHGAVTTVTLYNPQRRNAIGPQMVNELLWALCDAHADDAVRVIVITGEGSAFCAGGDFTAFTGGAEDEGVALASKGDYADLLLAMVRTEKPIIARVVGPAMGGGLGIVAASTFALADVGATFGTPEIKVGLFPMMIMAVLARHVPRRRLLEMMLFGQKLNAPDAYGLGLLNRVVSLEALDQAVETFAAEVMAKSARTVALGLRAFAAQDDMDIGEALALLRERLAECLATEDAQEGLTAFLEKRPPVWKGR